MGLNSNIEAGVYEDADFHRDFAAAMRKADCTPPAKNDEACRVPPAADSGLGVCAFCSNPRFNHSATCGGRECCDMCSSAASLPAQSQPVGAPAADSGLGVCAIKRGCTVRKNGIDYRVRAVNGRVVTLESFDGSFAFFSAVSVCKVVA